MMRTVSYNRPGWKTGKWYRLILVCTVLMFLYVSEQVGIVTLERSIYQTASETETMRQEVNRLRIEAANLKKSSRIKRIAAEELGMTVPEGIPATLF